MDNKQLQILLDNYFSLLGKAIDSARLHLEKNSGREDELYYKDMKHNKPYWMDEKKS